jgi:hypothetical protein
LMAQTYLSDLAGGPVSVGTASLSLLQGLQLRDVQVRVDDGTAADAVVFEARVIDIGYDPASLLRGRLEATRIVATEPRVTLVESTGGASGEPGRWNYQRLRPHRPAPSRPGPNRPAGPPPPLPVVVLRDARVVYAELAGGRLVPRGSVDVEGRVFPSADAGRYLFEMQSRGAHGGVGPVVAGQVQLRGPTSGQVDATLAGFSFGPDAEAMLPREVRDFWQAHQLRGAIDIPEFRYTPAADHARPTFRLRTRLRHVRLVIPTESFADATAHPTGASAPLPIEVDDVSGEYLFDQDGVRFHDVRGSLMGNTVSATGEVRGYSPTAAAHVRIETPPDHPLNLPPDLPYVASLPKAARDVYAQLKPSGVGTLWVELDRSATGGPPRVSARLTIADGAFDSVWFRYPVRHATGVVAVSPDPVRGYERLELIDIRGLGPAGGPNADRVVHLDGWVGPLDPRIGCGIRVAGDDFSDEPPLTAAFPPPVRQALTAFQGPAGEPMPSYRGDFTCHVDMPVGLGTKPVVTVDLAVRDASGRLAAFPYPLAHLSGHVHVGDGFVDLQDVASRQGDRSVTVGGRVSWNTGPGPANVWPDLAVSARNVPVDEPLLAVLPPAADRLAHRGGVTGLVDVDGHVSGKRDAATTGPTDVPVTYDLAVAFHDGNARPSGGDLVVSGLTADLRVTPDQLTLRALHGHRGDAEVSGHGNVDLPVDGPAIVRLSATARRVPLDRPLYALLPPAARTAWDAVAPVGAVDGDLSCTITGDDRTPVDYRLTLRPNDLTACPTAVPYRLDHVGGAVTIDPNTITIDGLHGTHGPSTVTLGGRGLTQHPDRWDLTLSTRQLPVDADLRRALPAAIRSALDRTKFHGNLDLDLTTLNYRGGADPDAADLDVAGSARASDASMDVGVPLERVTGGTNFAVAVRDGRVAAMRGTLDLDTVSLADRQINHLRAHLEQPAGSDAVHLTDVQAELAGGRVAGRIDLRFPAAAPDGATTAPTVGGGYAVALAVTDADVATIAGPAVPGGKPIHGRLSASLDLQGDWADPASRRGRGDVLVAGRDMYQIPLLLGLMEVTDLSLPTSAPFDQATARYAVDGKRVTFEQLQVRGDDLVMSGAGWLDFGTKRVRMNFTTDNPHMAGVPVLHDLWQGAKRELLQIQVRGTVQDPKVSAASFHTFTTTVDEVFKGGDPDR